MLEICFPFLLIVGDDHGEYHDDNSDDATDSEGHGHCQDDDDDYKFVHVGHDDEE